VRVPIWKL